MHALVEEEMEDSAHEILVRHRDWVLNIDLMSLPHPFRRAFIFCCGPRAMKSPIPTKTVPLVAFSLRGTSTAILLCALLGGGQAFASNASFCRMEPRESLKPADGSADSKRRDAEHDRD
mmetsp:Transcript_20201/g.58420  ORF Transcript_20201/g.58420 Transcript_20201/m.58420 type:complete len:119 (+) Transcript_20201:234-590(+)